MFEHLGKISEPEIQALCQGSCFLFVFGCSSVFNFIYFTVTSICDIFTERVQQIDPVLRYCTYVLKRSGDSNDR